MPAPLIGTPTDIGQLEVESSSQAIVLPSGPFLKGMLSFPSHVRTCSQRLKKLLKERKSFDTKNR